MSTSVGASNRGLPVLDRVLYALFSRHADRTRHDGDRKRYRATDVTASFDVYLSRTYGLSWVVFALTAGWMATLTLTVPEPTLSTAVEFLHRGTPILNTVSLPSVPRTYLALAVATVAGLLGKYATVRVSGLYLKWAADARQSNIDRTLPGAVRYLHALSSGSDDGAAMLRKVADREEAYGETAVAFRKVLNKSTLTGSFGEGLRLVARDTPSRDGLAPFLVKFREHAEQGPDSLS
ncbi:hypothetical protein [Halorussus halophilus]|uniref:hypothetical protein n=1 Tax=Halorussus halophilus TaxID=2650975 RepID=UPI001301595F|nr:hypothetical protein [Halorussus halophilus]